MFTCDYTHPSRTAPGSSQLKRANNAFGPSSVELDGRKLVDFLYYLFEYSKQVNSDQYFKDDEGEYTLQKDWRNFFEGSMPFQLARISKYRVEELSVKFDKAKQTFDHQPTPTNLNLLIDFTFEYAILPLQKWVMAIHRNERKLSELSGIPPNELNQNVDFKQRLISLIKAHLLEPLKKFIKSTNLSTQWYCTSKPNFLPFINQNVWGLQLAHLYKGEAKAPELSTLASDLTAIFGQFMSVIKQLRSLAPEYISQSLLPLEEAYQKYHEPHLGLLFSFLELFKYFQGDLNKLTEKHLDFFYRQVLKIKSRPHRPDHAHLVLEIAKHLDEHLLASGTLFKDGKDANGSDVFFKLKDEIIIDKARVESLRTLYLNQNQIEGETSKKTIIEGLYMAKPANSADGQGLAFPKGQTPNWSTLGSKESKINAPGKTIAAAHPHARIGLVLGSPVLFLQEGKREINLKICCRWKNDGCEKSVQFFQSFKDALQKALKAPYLSLTANSLNKLSNIFASDKIELFIEQVKRQSNYSDLCDHLNLSKNESILLKSFLNQDDLTDLKSKESSDPAGFLKTKAWQRIICKLTNLSSGPASAHLARLLAQQDPYVFGYDIEKCLNVNLEPSCDPIFDECEKEIVKKCLELEAEGYCLLDVEAHDCLSDGKGDQKMNAKKRLHSLFPSLFPDGDRKRYLPAFLNIERLTKKLKNGILEECEAKELYEILESLICRNIFDVSVTGPESWYKPQRVKTTISNTSGCDVEFQITITLDEEEPPVLCYNEETYEEKFKLEQPTPLLKIELNNELKLSCDAGLKIDESAVNNDKEQCCCLDRNIDENCSASLYHYFRCLEIRDTNIDVKVCGVKEHILLQNEEGLLDPNSPFTPFGVRPVIVDSSRKINPPEQDESQTNVEPGCPDPPLQPSLNLSGPCFYLASKEILGKCWKEICIHLNWKDKPSNIEEYYAAYDPSLKEEDFELNISLLEKGHWQGELPKSRKEIHVCCPVEGYLEDEDNPNTEINGITKKHNRELFQELGNGCACSCPKDLAPASSPFPFEQTIKIESQYFKFEKPHKKNVCSPLEQYKSNSRDGFLRLCLENQDFFHNKYAITLAKQLMSLTTVLPDAIFKIDELREDLGDNQFSTEELMNAIEVYLQKESLKSQNDVLNLLDNFISSLNVLIDFPGEDNDLVTLGEIKNDLGVLKGSVGAEFTDGLKTNIANIFKKIQDAFDKGDAFPIPNEPWTPTIKNLSLDYSACAGTDDINLIHLYPYPGTYKHEFIDSNPSLLPYYDDEGTLFIGLRDLRPAAELNLFFQLAEATADSELDRAIVNWHYLSNNIWQPLREGFEIISDGTNGLTVSGIVKIAIPSGISRFPNTVMPNDLHWIKASVSESDHGVGCSSDPGQSKPGKVKAICDTIAIHTQAANVTFVPNALNDLNRLDVALAPGSIAKMVQPEAAVKKITQPYAGFGGRTPEAGDMFYQRVSEHLRHKGRAIASFDYESLVLDAFPEIFKVKCINHDFGLSARQYRLDMELAPGFVVLAVIPDLTKLKPGHGMEPMAPVSLLEKIKAFLKKRISPFVRLKVLNSRFEKVGINATVKLRKGRNQAYYASKLKEDLTHFLAPWFITKDSDKLVFGQPVNHSEIIKFIERLDYIDFIGCLDLFADPELGPCNEEASNSSSLKFVEPLTARSILTAGEICVKILDHHCEKYCEEEDEQHLPGCQNPFSPVCPEKPKESTPSVIV